MYKDKKSWFFVVIILLIVGYYYLLNPYEQKDFFISCPFYNVTGYQCPGCGSQRAFHEVLHFNFIEAFKQNALFLLSIPYVLLIIFTSFNKEKHQKLRSILLGNKTLLFLLIISALFGVFRNL